MSVLSGKKIILGILAKQGYKPSVNWLKENIDELTKAPTDEDFA